MLTEEQKANKKAYMKAYNKAYRERNIEKIRERERLRYKSPKESPKKSRKEYFKAYFKAYNERHQETNKERLKEYRLANKGRLIEYRLANKGRLIEYRRQYLPKRQAKPFYYERNTWNQMKERCLNPTHPAYCQYGGAGITICEKWMSLKGFIEDMGERPEPKMRYSIDRIDNTKGYYKENCRWADDVTQSNNIKSNRILEYCGVKKTVSQWAKSLRQKPSTIFSRLRKGWSLERVLTLKPRLTFLQKAYNAKNL